MYLVYLCPVWSSRVSPVSPRPLPFGLSPVGASGGHVRVTADHVRVTGGHVRVRGACTGVGKIQSDSLYNATINLYS